jgi:hypothetical protein
MMGFGAVICIRNPHHEVLVQDFQLDRLKLSALGFSTISSSMGSPKTDWSVFAPIPWGRQSDVSSGPTSRQINLGGCNDLQSKKAV